MNRKILVGALVIVSVAALGLFGAASAQSNDEPVTAAASYDQRLEQVASDTQQARSELEENGARNCQLTSNHLRGLHAQSDLTLNYRTDTYQIIIDDANQLALNLEADNQSASDLRAAIAELSDRVTDFATSYSQYRAEIIEAANIACNEQTELRATVSRALSALRTSEFHAERVEDFAQQDLSQLLTSLERGDD